MLRKFDFVRGNRIMRAYRWLGISLLPLLLGACGGSDNREGEFYTHWDQAGGCASTMARTVDWINGHGTPVDVCAFPGDFVWVTYAALWCDTSHSQAPHVSAVVRSHGSTGNARFITTLTGGSEPFTEATVRDAAQWAARFGLDRTWVVTEGHSTRTIPQHALIGPDGRTWFRYVGMLRGEEIETLLDEFRSGARPAFGTATSAAKR
jgi:hypothetical protein